MLPHTQTHLVILLCAPPYLPTVRAARSAEGLAKAVLGADPKPSGRPSRRPRPRPRPHQSRYSDRIRIVALGVAASHSALANLSSSRGPPLQPLAHVSTQRGSTHARSRGRVTPSNPSPNSDPFFPSKTAHACAQIDTYVHVRSHAHTHTHAYTRMHGNSLCFM